MTIRECYESMGADFDEVLVRLRKETMIQRFALKFLQDSSYKELEKSLAEQDYKTAFRMAHTLKGTCANLSFTKLGSAAANLTEALRGGTATAEVPALFDLVKEYYQETICALNALQG